MREWRPPRGASSASFPGTPPVQATAAPVTDGDPPGAARRVGGRGWDVLLGLDLAFLAIGLVGAGILAGLGGNLPEADESVAVGVELLWAQAALSILLFAVIPFAWAVGTRVGGWQGAWDYLLLRRFWPHAAYGVLWTVALLGATAAFALGYEALGGSTDNPALDALTSEITWPLAIVMSLAAGVGEEILFRGILMRRLGVFGQAAVFGLAHIGYGTILQVAVPALLALFFGYLVRRTGSLWGAIVAHTLFDLAAFSAAIMMSAEDPSAALAWW